MKFKNIFEKLFKPKLGFPTALVEDTRAEAKKYVEKHPNADYDKVYWSIMRQWTNTNKRE